MNKKHKGFTLIEILFVVLIIATLAAVAIIRINTTGGTARANACKANQAIMNTQIEQYMLVEGSYPADQTAFEALIANTTYFPDGAPQCPEGDDANYVYNATIDRVDCNTTSPVEHSLH